MCRSRLRAARPAYERVTSALPRRRPTSFTYLLRRERRHVLTEDRDSFFNSSMLANDVIKIFPLPVLMSLYTCRTPTAEQKLLPLRVTVSGLSSMTVHALQQSGIDRLALCNRAGHSSCIGIASSQGFAKKKRKKKKKCYWGRTPSC